MPPALAFPNRTTLLSARRTHSRDARRPAAVIIFLTLLACAATIAGRVSACGRPAAAKPAQTPPATMEARKRVVAVNGGDTPEGSRLSVTADAPLDDYSSYVEGERVFVLISQAMLAGVKGSARGRGFEDMRVERRGDDVLLSFLLRQGATVRIGQRFNRLDITFYTNEHVSKSYASKDRS